MDELSKRIEHIQTVFSHKELRTLCFNLGLDYTFFESEDSYEFAQYVLRYLQEKGQLELLVHYEYLDESMSVELPSETTRLIQLHNVMMTSSDKKAVIQACNDIPLQGWGKYEQLDDRDFYREVILLSKRKGHLTTLENVLIDADLSLSLASYPIPSYEQQSVDSEQRKELIVWMKNEANANELAHLAFLMGTDVEEYDFGGANKDKGVKEFVGYFEKRDRLYQVVAAKNQILG